jgi:hypothetical protein
MRHVVRSLRFKLKNGFKEENLVRKVKNFNFKFRSTTPAAHGGVLITMNLLRKPEVNNPTYRIVTQRNQKYTKLSVYCLYF